jgi:tRNA(Ile2) C34 agmatinyltransferase TiaS
MPELAAWDPLVLLGAVVVTALLLLYALLPEQTACPHCRRRRQPRGASYCPWCGRRIHWGQP